MIQWFGDIFADIRGYWATITTIRYWKISNTAEGNPILISSHSPFSAPPTPWQPLIYYLSLQMCLLWAFPIKGIIHYVASFVWLPSHNEFKVHACSCMSMHVWTPHSILLATNIPSYGYITFWFIQLMDIWVSLMSAQIQILTVISLVTMGELREMKQE